MEASVIRSAISEDSPRLGDSWGVEEELRRQVERLQRRNALLEKSKMVLEEELQLNREEVDSKDRKIQQLTVKISKNSISLAHPLTPTYQDPQLQLILLEQQEQLGVLSEALRDRTIRLEELLVQNQRLRMELVERNGIIRQLKDSSRAQLAYQRTQIQALEQEIEEKHKEMASMRILFDNLAEKEAAKWNKLNETLKEKVIAVEEEKNTILMKQDSFAEERHRLKQRNQQLQQLIQKLNEKVAFLEGLLEEAKGEFINAYLQQQEQLEREQREKKQYRKRNQLLKTQLKSLKLDSSNSTNTSDPSNKSTRTSSIVSVTPFRTSCTRPKRNQHQ